METRKSKLQQIRDSIVADIRSILEKHSLDEMDVTDCGSTPVIWPSADDQDFDTYTLDRVYIGKDNVLVDSSSSDAGRTDRAEELGTDTLVNILEFLEDNEELIWQKDDDENEEFVMKVYHKGDGCMEYLLAHVKVGILPRSKSMTIEDVHNLYMRCKHEADGDEFFRENDACGDKGKRKNLLTGKSEPLKRPVFALQRVSDNDGVTDCCVEMVDTDRTEVEARLKQLRDKFVGGLGKDEDLYAINRMTDCLTDKPDFFEYYKFDTHRLFQLKIFDLEI